MSHDLNSRKMAFLILKKVLDDGYTLEGAFKKCFGEIPPSERGFIRHLTTSIVRHLGQLDKIIDHCTKTKLGNTQMAVRHVLRVGIAQLLYTDVPAYAAVDTTVSLMRNGVPKKLGYLTNTVNAVLRKVDREQDLFLKKFGNTRLNFPKWLLKSWDDRFGQAVVKDIISNLMNEAPLDICLKPELNKEEWADKLGGSIMPDGGVRLLKSGKVFRLEGYEEGGWWVQDFGARIPATILGADKGDRVLDLCAAPGGKAAQSAAKGAVVTAVDLSINRLKRLNENMERLNLNVDVIQSDILEYTPDEKYDYILLDAPCSSTGTIRRHPEILHMRRPKDVAEMVDIQATMLDHVAGFLNPGGIMVYCVCSLEKEEGPDQIKALLERQPSLKRKEISKDELPYLEQAILDTGDVQTLPQYIDGGMDGFFISRLIKQ